VVNVGGTWTVTVDDLAHLEIFQQGVHRGQSAQVAAQLDLRQPVHQRNHVHGAVEHQAGKACGAHGAAVGGLNGASVFQGQFASARGAAMGRADCDGGHAWQPRRGALADLGVTAEQRPR